MKRLLGGAVAIAGLFMGGSTGPVDLDYVNYSSAAISGYAGSASSGASHLILPDAHEELAEAIDHSLAPTFTSLTAVSSAAASETPQRIGPPLQSNFADAYQPDIPLGTTSNTSEGFPVGGPLLGESAEGKGKSAKNKTAGSAPDKSSVAMSGRAGAAHTHPGSTSPREAGCTRCSGTRWSSHPKLLVALLQTNPFRKHARVRREHLPTGTTRERELPILAAADLPL